MQNCGSCFAAEQFVSISWGPSARVKRLYRITVGKKEKTNLHRESDPDVQPSEKKRRVNV